MPDSLNVTRAAKIPPMAQRQSGLLAQIKADVMDRAVPLSSLLQQCIMLGLDTGSEKMRDWARQELNGYTELDTLPEYRRIPAPLMAMITNTAGYNGRSTRIDPSVFDPRIRDMLRDKDVDLHNVILTEGIGVLEAMASKGADEHTLLPSWATFIAQTLNEHHIPPGSRVAEVYWSVSNVAIQGLLVRIRIALTDLVAELIMLTPQDQDVPGKQAADQAMQLVITGDGNTIHFSPQHAADGGMNVMVAEGSAAGPVTGPAGNASGSPTGRGANSSVLSSQAVQAGYDAVAAGKDATVTGAEDQPVKGGFWARLRKRGAVATAFVIIGGIAGIGLLVFAVLTFFGVAP